MAGDRTKVLVFGGIRLHPGSNLVSTTVVLNDTISVLDLLSGQWSTLATSPLVQRVFHSACAVVVPVGPAGSDYFPSKAVRSCRFLTHDSARHDFETVSDSGYHIYSHALKYI